MGEEEQDTGERKGFAGLSSLISEVEMTPPNSAKSEPSATAVDTGSPTLISTQSQYSQQHQTYQEPVQPSASELSAGKWLLGIVAVLVIIGLIIESNKNSSTTPSPYYIPTDQSQNNQPQTNIPINQFDPATAKLNESQIPSTLDESKPPFGQNIVFSTSQIKYCLAEDIRLQGAKTIVNNYIESDVDLFNSLVNDYNSRCGSFRYHRGDLESARQDIEPYRNQLQSEGQRRFSRASTDSSLTPLPVQSNPITVLSSAPINTPTGIESLNYDERDAIETACVLKRAEGSASYDKCVTLQIADLANAPRKPDLSVLSFDERDAIETACILKRAEGAASYNRCVVGQVRVLEK